MWATRARFRDRALRARLRERTPPFAFDHQPRANDVSSIHAGPVMIMNTRPANGGASTNAKPLLMYASPGS